MSIVSSRVSQSRVYRTKKEVKSTSILYLCYRGAPHNAWYIPWCVTLLFFFLYYDTPPWWWSLYVCMYVCWLIYPSRGGGRWGGGGTQSVTPDPRRRLRWAGNVRMMVKKIQNNSEPIAARARGLDRGKHERPQKRINPVSMTPHTYMQTYILRIYIYMHTCIQYAYIYIYRQATQ